MNFRILSSEELSPLEKDFTIFLVANGIDADEWQKIKSNDLERAQEYLKGFSDSVWFKIFSSRKYMTYKSENNIYYLDFQNHKMLNINVELFEGEVKSLGLKEQEYHLTREEDMYQWSLLGAEFSSGEEFRSYIVKWFESK
jgi:hypothetical protein